MTTQCVGKIQSVRFGMGGYQDAMFGVSWQLGSDKPSWSVCDFWGAWPTDEGIGVLVHAMRRLHNTLLEAKLTNLDDLVDVPIQATFDNDVLKSWRVLTEVI